MSDTDQCDATVRLKLWLSEIREMIIYHSTIKLKVEYKCEKIFSEFEGDQYKKSQLNFLSELPHQDIFLELSSHYRSKHYHDHVTL
mgnify:CR=1 FL=1